MEGDNGFRCEAFVSLISIHALRVEGDIVPPPLVSLSCCISIHALRVEGDTSPLLPPPSASDFYPRPPGGGRQPAFMPLFKIRDISIHALRVEGDATLFAILFIFILFLSTPSGWRATSVPCRRVDLICISIHALRVEGDRDFIVHD